MKMTEIRVVALDRGVKPGRLKKADLIREIQKAENNPQCFLTGMAEHCGQLSCLWREDCN
ncbi:MAG: SAP domain-containing protein [Desulfuromonas sp.]|nr:MAG: SAP domain-containing protein [Desulfuromonas sp.]